MPTYLITAPDGRKFNVTGDGTAEEALAHIQQMAGTQSGPDFSEADAATNTGAVTPGDLPAAHARANPRGSIMDPIMQGLTFGFGDEIAGVGGGVRSLVEGKGFGAGYDKAVASSRADLENYRTRHPIASTAAEIGASLPTAAIIPGGGAARAATWGGRILRGAAGGAGVGAAYGAGTAEGGLPERASGAAEGGLTGAALGGIIPAATGAIGATAGAITRPIRGMINPEKEAARRVVGALSRDTQGQPERAVRQLESAQRQGTPLIVADTGTAAGGRTTQALMRSAANSSPDARAALEPVLNERFGTQNVRAAAVIGNLIRTHGNATLTRDALEQAARTSRSPYYKAAYKAGAGGVLTPEIQQLAQSPVMQRAMKEAATSIQNKAATGRAMAPMSPSGTPTLEYWDQVKRSLDGFHSVAKRAGDNEVAADIDATRKALIGQLDRAVPEYATARGVAATLFKANDALDAGEKFVESRMSNTEASQALAKMTPEEKALFREGFVSKYLDKVMSSPDRRSILSQIQANPQARARIDMVLGPMASKKLDAFVTVESVMDATKNALGNSTTARQLAEIGLAGGAGLAVSGGNIYDPKSWITAALVYGSKRGFHNIDQRVVRQVGEMLASKEPETVLKAINLVARTPKLGLALRKAEEAISKIGAGPGVNAFKEPLRLTVTGGSYAQGDQPTQ